jgi:hypothetical protein
MTQKETINRNIGLAFELLSKYPAPKKASASPSAKNL